MSLYPELLTTVKTRNALWSHFLLPLRTVRALYNVAAIIRHVAKFI